MTREDGAWTKGATRVPQNTVAEHAMETVACVCGESRTASSPIRARDDLTGRRFDYLRCARCGIERCSPRPVAGAIGAYYPASYAAHVVRAESLAARIKRLVYVTFWAGENRLGKLRPLLRLLLWPIRGRTVLAFRAPPGRRVFEFGAAAGNDLAVFRDAGWDVSGCEPSARACALAAARGIILQNCPAEAAALVPASVSCILLNNVFEHLHDPVRVLQICAAALRPGGVLVLILPNHAGWSARLFGPAWPGYDAPRHLWGFAPRPLVGLLARHGFRTEHIYHQAPGRWAWQSALDGRHAADPPPAWRRRAARWLVPALLPIGVLAAMLGQGDFIKVVARRSTATAPAQTAAGQG